MEEILASIRRIIADDQDGAAPAASLVRQDDGVGPGSTAAGAVPEARTDAQGSASRPGSAGRPPPSAPPPRPRRRSLPEPDRLLSSVAQLAAGALKMLSTTVLNANPRTLEDLVTDLIRPMLKGSTRTFRPSSSVSSAATNRIARSTRWGSRVSGEGKGANHLSRGLPKAASLRSRRW